jgi:hypothetical protein
VKAIGGCQPSGRSCLTRQVIGESDDCMHCGAAPWAVGTVVGLAPHVLHHVGLLVGTALVAGAAGTLIFGLLGLAASVPMLLRLKRRFGTWWAPALGLAVFAAMFSVSAFVIGPAISGNDQSEQQQLPTPTPHAEHHS